jgi:capsular exopolysaccharide synthesis family protein
VLVKPSSVFAETVRSLRTLLWLTDLQSRAKLVAVTSSRRGEGKTTTAVSLARVAAQSGERVIIIDCDLTRPSIHLAFKQGSADSGLTDLVLGRASRREVTKTDPNLATLHYITAGGRANQLSELLRSDNMIALMREVRNEYDLVVVDTPPALVLSDAKVLATMADAVVYCILWRSTSRSVAGTGIRSLLDVGANVLCAALTQVKFRSLRLRDRMDHEAYAAGRAARSATPGTGDVAAWRA